jgi:predicted lipoprotein with Yx(FWY)xxD motif
MAKTRRYSRLLSAASALVLVGTLSAQGTLTASASTNTSHATINFKAIGPPKATGKTLSLAKGKAGVFVIGPNGHTLYIFTKDKGLKTACTGKCATFWPALTATGPITVGPGINKAALTKVDAQKPDQIAYYGHLLYYFAHDTAPGQTAGTAIPDWDLLGPFGNVMLPKA